MGSESTISQIAVGKRKTMSKTGAMTVRDAFALAGLPIPEGGSIGYSWGNHKSEWFGRVSPLHNSDRAGQGFKFMAQWTYFPCEPGHTFEPLFDISNAPAKDALHALPGCVQQVILRENANNPQ